MHAPSAARDIKRRLKGDEDPRALLADAARIDDPGWAAEATLEVSGDRRLQFDEARHGALKALRFAKQVERPGRQAELWGLFSRAALTWRQGARNPEAPAVRQRILDTALEAILNMPDGEWTQAAIAQAAPHAGPAGRQRLLGRALSNRGFEAAGAKAVLRAADHDADGLRALLAAAPPEVRAAALADDDALRAAWTIQDADARAEALRVLIWKEDDPERLHDIARSAAPHGAADFVRIYTQVGARLDKIGQPSDAMLAAAAARLPEVAEPQRSKLARKLDEAQARAAGADAAPAQPARSREAQDGPLPALPTPLGHTLALVNTYDGGLKVPHLRAAGRAAPLCAAFGLDLALIDFPIDDAAAFVQAAEAETGVGEGGAFLRRLLAAGRIHTTPPTGTWVATTPKPEADKATPLRGLPAPVVVFMGVGPRGLPTRILNESGFHHEVTGHGISLETATAMGILADRLAGASEH